MFWEETFWAIVYDDIVTLSSTLLPVYNRISWGLSKVSWDLTHPNKSVISDLSYGMVKESQFVTLNRNSFLGAIMFIVITINIILIIVIKAKFNLIEHFYQDVQHLIFSFHYVTFLCLWRVVIPCYGTTSCLMSTPVCGRSMVNKRYVVRDSCRNMLFWSIQNAYVVYFPLF